jgi:hypothetical protein
VSTIVERRGACWCVLRIRSLITSLHCFYQLPYNYLLVCGDCVVTSPAFIVPCMVDLLAPEAGRARSLGLMIRSSKAGFPCCPDERSSQVEHVD